MSQQSESRSFFSDFCDGLDEFLMPDLEVEITRDNNGWSLVMIRPSEGKTFRFEVSCDPDSPARREDIADGGVAFKSRMPFMFNRGEETDETDLVRVSIVPCQDGELHDHVIVGTPKSMKLCVRMSFSAFMISGVGSEEEDEEADLKDLKDLYAEAEAAYDAAGWPKADESVPD